MNERGIAVPTALIALAVLTALVMAFAVLANTEPLIASNHSEGARARAFAEAGVERAIWALSNSTAPGGLADPLPSPVPAPYDGGTFVMVERGTGGTATGGFRVQVAAAVSGLPNEREVVSVGYTPDNVTPRAIKRIETTVMKIRHIDPPCALCVMGDIEVTGSSSIDARSGGPASGVHCPGGPPPLAGVATAGTTYRSGAARVWGPGDNLPNNVPADIHPGAPASTFAFKFTDEELAYLKSLARERGTYYQGSVTFNSSNPIPDGIVFVDTTTGDPFTSSTPDSEAAAVEVHGGTNWKGWLIVAGSLQISGEVDMRGLIYALNDIAYSGTGNGGIRGSMVSENRKDTFATSVDGGTTGNSNIVFDCEAVRNGGGQIPQGWFVRPGSYREVAGQ